MDTALTKNAAQRPMDDTAVFFEEVGKSFGKVHANSNITFDVKRGEVMALLGENGSGKTTLMNMLAGIYFPDSGHIYHQDAERRVQSAHRHGASAF